MQYRKVGVNDYEMKWSCIFLGKSKKIILIPNLSDRIIIITVSKSNFFFTLTLSLEISAADWSASDDDRYFLRAYDKIYAICGR